MIMFVGNYGFSQEGQKIGINNEGVYIITENIDNIKDRWAQIMIDKKIVGTLTKFSIKEGIYEDNTNEKYYYLIGSNDKSNINFVTSLIYSRGAETFSIEEASQTVSCSGCQAGCSPQKLKRVGWVCTEGCSQCVKTETITF